MSLRVCTKAEEERDCKAYELARISGYPSVSELIHLIEDGNITGMPALPQDDALQVYDLFGTPPAYMRGKMTKRSVKQEAIEKSLVMMEKKQRLFTSQSTWFGTTRSVDCTVKP